MKTNHKKWLSVTLAAGVVLSGFAAPQVSAEGESETSYWTREQAEKIEQNEDNTLPYTDVSELEKFAEGYHVWDSWPLTDRDGEIARIKGYQVLFALTAPDDVLPGKVHDIARIRYFYSKNGKDWEMGGTLFPDGASLGSREWAGSAIMDDGKIHAFYTATGRRGEEASTFEQRLAMATGDITADKNGVHFDNWGEHKITLEPDGEYYQTKEQAQNGEGGGYAFRDPQWFKDPKTDKEYILFEGNSGGAVDERTFKKEFAGSDEYLAENPVPEGAVHANANIGIAEVIDGDPSNLKMMPPLLEANYVNEELERPHIIVKDKQYYLFTDTHVNKYAEGISGPEGLYGFVSDTLIGGYEPLNESGLVLANPEENPYQAYSWLVLPSLNVVGFAHFGDIGDLSIGDLGNQPADYQFEKFGGTLAPTAKISINDDTTEFVKQYEQGWIK
ncbi:glycoside hydrolase family 68 protein [Jeotgalibacillus haloalkalitolerans]|uniref:Glycoside hydrolase family 68 protein n=1 Tax=Jeotgalibacillus haloalkalitolerans TaxID=3104292 RepID=A0ABU5KNI6_9BACL|nr:glycoside hydrolase family 68 protein [Jeotgalibacillus sp. HH7-29]MDZ5712821.1 glycoside hydrolase family 68 protein [Jeotgalibacillus sp. HH7-29]